VQPPSSIFARRTRNISATRFFYVLPFDERHALVEYTLFSNRPLLPREYEQALQAYLRDVLKVDDYQIARQESGVIPVTDQPQSPHYRPCRSCRCCGARGCRARVVETA
jgi:lycopene beta-cyclase